MTTLNCGCRIITDIISLNDKDEPNWQYFLKTFVNLCGKCGKKQMKFNYMENKIMEMEKQRMNMFIYDEDEDASPEARELRDPFFENLREMKEHLKTIPANERHKVKDFERLRNLANGLDPNEGMDEIDMVINQLEEEEEREREEEIERRIEDNTFDPYDIM